MDRLLYIERSPKTVTEKTDPCELRVRKRDPLRVQLGFVSFTSFALLFACSTVRLNTTTRFYSNQLLLQYIARDWLGDAPTPRTMAPLSRSVSYRCSQAEGAQTDIYR